MARLIEKKNKKKQKKLSWQEILDQLEEDAAAIVAAGSPAVEQVCVSALIGCPANEVAVQQVLFHPEYAAFMVETTPGRPFGSDVAHMLTVETNMARRRALISVRRGLFSFVSPSYFSFFFLFFFFFSNRQPLQARLGPRETYMTLTNFPRLGCPGFTTPLLVADGASPVTKSLFFPDMAINPHPRFATLTANIRERRGAKVAINLPVLQERV
jgi:glutamate--cysteine ligase catalytic subunit